MIKDASAIYESLMSDDLQLNLPKIMQLEKHQQDLIIKLFDDLMQACAHGGGMQLPGGIDWHVQKMNVLYNTLTTQGWLVNTRHVKLDKLV